ncbi:TIM44-like domain-containing protein [Desulfosporosinus sp. PR]|uniref:TIM44-like domain-containing protein n=1 Tax=Candidatus Desulfosporosinus nitrosoreducens TaxID=3401928 RepID=UPI0027FD5A81|nr:TIM44-like domain-containing protein [Desulfosporosinus sp. PR]MDQ7096997.1 TIM44-like domain-containing protein [Desulfosporosinus sp. PR]
MNFWTKRIAVILTTLILSGSQVSLALARGGGGLGGSLGDSSGGSFSGGSFSGGGHLGGGGLGGFFPIPFFFGGYGSGGILFLVILYIAWRFLNAGSQERRRWGRNDRFPSTTSSKTVNNDRNSRETAVDLNGRPISNSENLQRFGKAINYTRENMSYLAETFSRWDRDFLVGRVRQVFFWLQDSWSRQDLSRAEEYLITALNKKYQTDLQGMKARGERNIIKEPILNTGDIEFIHSHLDEESQYFIVMVFASLIDYTLDDSGKLISGNDKHRLYFTEFWKFVWQDEKWLLASIYQEDALEIAKIARGIED